MSATRKTARQKATGQRVSQEANANRERKFRNAIEGRTSCMSNAKWRKVFVILEAFGSGDEPFSIRLKFVERETEYSARAPRPGDLGERWVYEGRTLPFEYREIEWLDVVTRDADAVAAALASAGQFAIDVVSDGLRVYGYR